MRGNAIMKSYNLEDLKKGKINTLEKAEYLFKLMGCSTYHILLESAKLMEEYASMKISRDQELQWIKEVFYEQCNMMKTNIPENWYLLYNTMVGYLSAINERTAFEEVLNITNDLMSRKIDKNHYSLFSSIIGTNDSKKHGGLIQYCMENEYNDLAMECVKYAFMLKSDLKSIISENDKKHFKWLCSNLNDVLEVYNISYSK